MSIKEFIEKLDVSQEDFAAFMGIPRGRIAFWISQKMENPPKAADAKTYQLAVSFLSNKSPEQIKSIVKNYRIILGNVEPLEGYNKVIEAAKGAAAVEEPASEYKINSKEKIPTDYQENINLQYPYKTEENIPMTERLMRMIDRSIANEERITIALERVTRTNENLTMMLSHIVIPTQPESVKK